MRWQRIPDPDGGRCVGYRLADRAIVERHEVDDRDYDGGYALTQWHLAIDGRIEAFNSLAQAKAYAERVVAST